MTPRVFLITKNRPNFILIRIIQDSFKLSYPRIMADKTEVILAEKGPEVEGILEDEVDLEDETDAKPDRKARFFLFGR